MAPEQPDDPPKCGVDERTQVRLGSSEPHLFASGESKRGRVVSKTAQR